MQKCKMGVPGRVRLGTESQRMVARQTEVVGAACIDEREPAGGVRVPGVSRNLVECGLQLRLTRADVRGVDHWRQIYGAVTGWQWPTGLSPPFLSSSCCSRACCASSSDNLLPISTPLQKQRRLPHSWSQDVDVEVDVVGKWRVERTPDRVCRSHETDRERDGAAAAVGDRRTDRGGQIHHVKDAIRSGGELAREIDGEGSRPCPVVDYDSGPVRVKAGPPAEYLLARRRCAERLVRQPELGAILPGGEGLLLAVRRARGTHEVVPRI